jgi:ElaB/YqjD/DUF883 family membrane-anchored ribosome-binding protein
MAMTGTIERKADSVISEIQHLRDMADALLRDRLAPGLNKAGRRADAALNVASARLQEQGKIAGYHVREQPLLSLAVVAGLGFLIGRFVR